MRDEMGFFEPGNSPVQLQWPMKKTRVEAQASRQTRKVDLGLLPMARAEQARRIDR